ncbi:MAG: hypothetical protein PVF76_13675 [Syntrophobacterales bacterium]|jgi:hypothetical protein
MTPEETLQLLLAKLDQCSIPYMITGSFASNMHGVPRATYDADVVIDADRKSLDEFIESLAEQFYVSQETARDALARERMFNVVHLETGFKVDLIIKKRRAFSQEEFSRREQAIYLGEPRWFATAEDVILAKLEWSKLGDSERQFIDALNVAKIQGDKLDKVYLEKWARELDLEELLARLFHGFSQGGDRASI